MEKTYYFRVNFITLTLPSKQMHPDKQIVAEALHRFIDAMRKRWSVEDYLWRAECQINGNLHFHVSTNQFIPWEWVRKQWNKSIEPLGYIDEFEKKFRHRNPNSTDIHAVHNVRNYGAYMSKYLAKTKSFAKVGTLHLLRDGSTKEFSLYDTKKEGKIIGSVLSEKLRIPECRTWFCSRSISQLKPLKYGYGEKEYNEIERMLKESNDLFVSHHDHGSTYSGNVFSYLNAMNSLVAKQLKYGFKQVPRDMQPELEKWIADREALELREIEISETQARQFYDSMLDDFTTQLAFEF